MNAPVLPRIAIATGDPAGIGPEIARKAAVSPAVTAICRPDVVGDPAIIDRQAKASGISHERRLIERVAEADWSSGVLHVLACRRPNLARLELGSVSAAAGEASLACAGEAIRAALGGEVEAVVAAPQNQTSIALAKIVFDGYPSFVARETGLAPGNVFLMLC